MDLYNKFCRQFYGKESLEAVWLCKGSCLYKKNKNMESYLKHLKNHIVSFIHSFKSHYWFKNYGDFAEWVDFAYWWSFIGEGFAINGAIRSSLTRTRHGSPIDNRPLLTPLLGKITPLGLRHFTSPYLLNKTGN